MTEQRGFGKNDKIFENFDHNLSDIYVDHQNSSINTLKMLKMPISSPRAASFAEM